MKHRVLLSAIVLLATVFLFGACSDDDSPVKPPVVTVPGFESPQAVAVAFLNAYRDMDPAALAALLDPDYTMTLQAEAAQEFPLVGGSLDRAAELRIAGRLFSGAVLTDPGGQLIPPISAVNVQVFEQRSSWAPVEAGLDFAGSQAALFDVVVRFDRPGYSQLKVEGALQFFVASHDTTIGGTDYTYWLMNGQKDLTLSNKQGVEGTSWSMVKGLFWVAE